MSPNNHNKYIVIIEDTTDDQVEYTNLNDLKNDLNTDLRLIGLCVIDIKKYEGQDDRNLHT